MKRLWRRTKAEWEMALCVLAALAFLCALLFVWTSSHTDRAQTGSRKQTKRPASLLGPDAYAFLQPVSTPTGGEAPSPFVFEGTLKEEKRPKTTQPKQPKTRPKVAPAPKPPVVVTKDPAPPPTPPAPTPPKVTRHYVFGERELKFLFAGNGASGRPAATIQMRDLRTGATAPLAIVPVGGAVDGIRIVSVDRSYLTVVDARGIRHRIAFGKSARVKSGPTVVESRP